MHRPLTADTVRGLVRTALGDAAGVGDGLDVRPVDEAGEQLCWWIGTRHVLRLAPDPAASVRQRREIRVRDLVRPHVGVPVPASSAAGEWANGLAFTLDTRLPGASAEGRAVSPAGEADLAGLLSGLRSVPVRAAAALGLPVTTPRSLEKVRAQAARAAQRVDADGEFDPGRLDRLTPRAIDQLAPLPGTGVVVHHDLTGEHLKVTADGRVCGVLDWADAVIGDPAEDIAGLAVAVGAPAAVRAATLAGYEARLCLRGLWLARCDTVIRLAGRLQGQDEGPRPLRPLLRAQLRRTWEAILLERLTDVPEQGPDPGQRRAPDQGP
ncbi:phosphotransferase family protein [Streptomyces himalayensis]|uniref:Aminoglycoside phosphotransferase family protein n=1 Tax=Streptomyces himalayensis subsp. himalayensis TaxID=2756131 RepID=A0A7W0DMA2_9ACTN|nr:aminoglycoside phosphotransferase family protein [Streptomyces himalayensis]MBA2947712.1 aminoglycoside phosphotransferase family protein [Streptomyces himalayensis subsp. himalayensis]